MQILTATAEMLLKIHKRLIIFIEGIGETILLAGENKFNILNCRHFQQKTEPLENSNGSVFYLRDVSHLEYIHSLH